ncbi:MAG: EthD domain-containing protein [Sphingomonadaceae bacterium]
MPKLVYLTRRHPSFQRSEWTARWRQHGALGMSLPRWKNVARYVHCDLIEPSPAHVDLLPDYDGIGLIWHRSLAHRDAHFSDRSSQEIMEQDEAETFAEPISRNCVSMRETAILPVQGVAKIRVFCFMRNGEALDTPDKAQGHVRNHPLPAPQGRSWGLDCTSLEEFWFDGLAVAQAALPGIAAPDRICAIGHQTELYNIG